MSASTRRAPGSGEPQVAGPPGQAGVRAVVTAATHLPGVRSAALGLVVGEHLELIASDGDDADAMASGTRVPLGSVQPMAEVLCGPVGARGSAGWVAVPVDAAPLRGALLVSLRPPGAPADVAALEALARVASTLLQRTGHEPYPREAPVHVATVPALPSPPGWLDVAVDIRAVDGEDGGDIVDVVPDGVDGCWLVVADVCGRGVGAGLLAAGVRRAARAATTGATSPAHLLSTLDHALTADPAVDRFVTAAVAHVRRGRGRHLVRAASAGHPAPLLATPTGVHSLAAPALPLNLGLAPGSAPSDSAAAIGDGEHIVLYSDGLIDRLGREDGDDVLRQLLPRATRLAGSDAVAEALLAAVESVAGASRDDQALLVARVLPS